MAPILIEAGLTKAAVRCNSPFSARTVAKFKRSARKEWMDRDRSTRPLLSKPNPAFPCAEAGTLGRQRHRSNRSQSRPVVSPATFSPIRRRLGLNRLRNLGPAEPERRYEREHSGGPDPGRYQKARQGDHIGQRLMDRTGQSSLRGRTAETDASVSSTSVQNSIGALYRSIGSEIQSVACRLMLTSVDLTLEKIDASKVRSRSKPDRSDATAGPRIGRSRTRPQDLQQAKEAFWR